MRQKRNRGDLVKIDLEDGRLAFAQVLKIPLFVFFDIVATKVLPIDRILAAPIAFKIWVMDYAVTKGIWPVIGNAPVGDVDETPAFFKRDPITGKISIYREGVEHKATLQECQELECAAVWDPEHVVDRLRDHFDRKPNKWVESMRLK